MIEVVMKPDTFELEIKGHAGHGKKGEDIVCSAISILFYTLGQTLLFSEKMLEEPPIFKNEDGHGYLSCKPKKEFEGNIARSYLTIFYGFELVAENYKKFVNLSLQG